MTVYDFCDLAVDDSYLLTIYDMNSSVEDEVFLGEMRDAMHSEFEGYEVLSFEVSGTLDGQGMICLNIDTTEDD